MMVRYIIQGWWNWFISLFVELRYHELFRHRMDVCNACEHNKKGVCDVCGCVLKAKTKSDSSCSIGKWE